MKAYRLTRSPLGEPSGDFEPRLLDRALTRRVSFASPHDWTIDEPVDFEVRHPRATRTDYPATGAGVPLLLRRVVEALLTVGGFQSRSYATRVVDQTGHRIDGGNDYVLFHLRTTLDVFDWIVRGTTNFRPQRAWRPASLPRSTRWCCAHQPI